MTAQPVFFRELLARIPLVSLPDGSRPLAALTVRDTSDPTIALLYAWAMAGDVISFYQQRLFHEGFLETATERLSVVELARLIGYRVLPGVAASAQLAFSVVEAQEGEAPPRVLVPRGTAVTSVPPGSGSPQTFETSEPLDARAAWNALVPRLTRPQLLTPESRGAVLAGIDTGLEAGDAILLLREVLTPDGPQRAWRFLMLRRSEADSEANVTRIEWGLPLGESAVLPDPRIYALPTTAAFFGADAPDWSTQPFAVQLANTPVGRQPQDYENWPNFAVPNGPFDLDAVYADIVPDSWLVQRRPAALRLEHVGNTMTVARTDFTISAQVTRVFPDATEEVECDRAVDPARSLHTSTLLPDGLILIVGGCTGDGAAIANASIYDPATLTVEPVANLSTPRWNHTATLLGDGTVLIAGGENESGPLASAELYLPAGSLFIPATGAMTSARSSHRATLLTDATVLLTGGTTTGGEVLDTAERFEPSTATFSGPIAMTAKRRNHAAALYGSGSDWSVLIAGGSDGANVLSSAETFDVVTLTFTATSGAMAAARELHTATVVTATGAVLLAGGRSADRVPSTPAAEQFTPAGGTFGTVDGMTPRWNATATALQNGGILIAGGTTASDDAITTVEVFANDGFLSRVPLDVARASHSANLLSSGEVVLACGVDATGAALDSVSQYDSNAFTFVVTGALPEPAYGAGGTLLENGYFLVTGGVYNTAASNFQRAASLYDPALRVSTATGSMSTARCWHTSTLIDGGGVLVAGGYMQPYENEIQKILDLLEKLLVLVGTLTGLVGRIENDATDAETQRTAIINALQSTFVTGCFCAGAWFDADRPTKPPCPNCTFGSDDTAAAQRGETSENPDPMAYAQRADETSDSLFGWTNWLWLTAKVPFGVAWDRSPDGSNPLWQQASFNFSLWSFAVNSVTTPLNLLYDDLQDILDTITGDNGMNALISQINALIAEIIAEVKRIGVEALDTAEIYNPSTAAFTATNEAMLYIRVFPAASRLQDGRVLISGGMGFVNDDKQKPNNQALATAELFEPGSGSFVATAGPMADARNLHTSTLLPNGMVLIAGGQTLPVEGGLSLASAELFDPVTSQFAAIPPMHNARAWHTATLLPDGSVLLTGGMTKWPFTTEVTASAEVWNPRLAMFVQVADMSVARTGHSAELLPDGRVLIMGGLSTTSDPAVDFGEIFDPATGLFTPAGSMALGVFAAVSCRTGNGDVLLAGGATNEDWATPSATSQLFVAPAPAVEGDIRRDTVIYGKSTPLDFAPDPIDAPVAGTTIELQTLERELPRGRAMIVSGVPLTVERPFAAAPIAMITGDDVVMIQPGERLRLNAIPSFLPEEVEWRLETMFGIRGTIVAPPDAFDFLDVASAPGIASESIAPSDVRVSKDGARTLLLLDEPLRYVWHRTTVTIAANVVGATQGETLAGEILGSGSSALANQQFPLRVDPVTWVPAPNPRGVGSTIDVRVNDIRWSEVPSLLEAGPGSQVFAVSNDLQGRTQIVFGDGENGSRLPTGADNVVATYRTGVAAEGNVGANTLTVLPETVEGMERVTNPMPAGGGSAPQSRDSIRLLAPLSVQPIDRIVSLGDFAAFALGFAGIAKADAILANGIVYVTVAGSGGAAVDPGSALGEALRNAMIAAVAPGIAFELASYRRIAFRLAARLRIDVRYDRALVLDAARAALVAAFRFDARTLGAGVAASEVIAVLAEVSGVIAADLDAFSDPAAGGPPLVAWIPARGGRVEGGRFLPAEAVVIDESALVLTGEESA